MTPREMLEPEPDDPLFVAIRVPLLLIVLGALFLLEDCAEWSIRRTWPILLVVWGASLILARRGREA